MDGIVSGTGTDNRTYGELIAPDALASAELSFEGDVIRNVSLDGKLWFVSSDVCKALDMLNPRGTISRLGPNEKGKIRLQTEGGEQEVNVVSESGLYLLAFNSRKAGAEAFRIWVTDEVLPSLRRGAAGEAQDVGPGKAYVRLPGPGRFRVTLETNGHLSIDELDPNSYVSDFYSPEVDALALSSCLVAVIWRKFQLLDSMSALNAERSNTRYQLANAIKQAEHIAKSTMRTRTELVDGRDAQQPDCRSAIARQANRSPGTSSRA